MKFIYFIALFSVLIASCKKEVEKEQPEELQGYSSQGNLLVIEVADTFVNVIEYNLDIHPDYHWDSMPIYSDYFYYVDTLSTIVGWIQCVGHDKIGNYSLDMGPGLESVFFPSFYTSIDGTTIVPKKDLINNQSQVELNTSKIKLINPNQPLFEFQDSWDKINNLRVTIQYRHENPSSQVGILKSTLYTGETRYYFFLAKY